MADSLKWEAIYGDLAEPAAEPVGDDLAVLEQAERERLEGEGRPAMLVELDIREWRERRERRAKAAADVEQVDRWWDEADEATKDGFIWTYVHLGLARREHGRWVREAGAGRLLTSFRPSRVRPLRESPGGLR